MARLGLERECAFADEPVEIGGVCEAKKRDLQWMVHDDHRCIFQAVCPCERPFKEARDSSAVGPFRGIERDNLSNETPWRLGPTP